MEVIQIPRSKEEFIQDLKYEFEYTEEEIAFELKKVEAIIKEKNLIAEEDIKNVYGEAYASLIVDEYYEMQEPDYLDKMLQNTSKELNEKYPITKKE